MKTVTALIAAGMLLVAGAAHAQRSPREILGFGHDPRFDGATWCASGLQSQGGGRDCAFFSQRQCLETVRGLGGFCTPAAQWADGPRGKRKYKKSRRHSHR